MIYGDWIGRWGQSFPDKEALVDVIENRRYTYGQLADDIHRMANFLRQDLGIKQGDRVDDLSFRVPLDHRSAFQIDRGLHIQLLEAVQYLIGFVFIFESDDHHFVTRHFSRHKRVLLAPICRYLLRRNFRHKRLVNQSRQNLAPALEDVKASFAWQERGAGVGQGVPEVLTRVERHVHARLALPDVDACCDILQTEAPFL